MSSALRVQAAGPAIGHRRSRGCPRVGLGRLQGSATVRPTESTESVSRKHGQLAIDTEPIAALTVPVVAVAVVAVPVVAVPVVAIAVVAVPVVAIAVVAVAVVAVPVATVRRWRSRQSYRLAATRRRAGTGRRARTGWRATTGWRPRWPGTPPRVATKVLKPAVRRSAGRSATKSGTKPVDRTHLPARMQVPKPPTPRAMATARSMHWHVPSENWTAKS